jgi:septum formation protein
VPRIDASFPLVLGSASPRRREMMAMLGVPFVVCSADVDESRLPGEAARDYLDRVTQAKLDAVRARAAAAGFSNVPPSLASGQAGVGQAAVLVADTVVVAPDGVILGKPRDDDEAHAMVERLAGATHDVSTRFLLAGIAPSTPPAHAQTVTTRVTFRALRPGEASAYAASGEGRDKAGAYAVQGRAAAFIERIDGSYTGVVGLPLCEVVVALQALGWIGRDETSQRRAATL